MTQSPDHARFSGRTILISGAARGLGEAFARGFHAEGGNVVITDVLTAEGEALAAALGERALFVRHDVTISAEWEAAVAAGEAAFGPIAVLCNNAGVHDHGAITDFTEAQFRRLVDINQLGCFLGMQAVIPSMRRGGGGSIVNSSSTAGLAGFPFAIGYVASKWAVRGMSKAAALELGVDNIRVNSIHPGMIDTAMSRGFVPNADQPIPRAGTVEEVARLVLFLASDDARYCTGGEFVIDGGQSVVVGMPPARVETP